MKYYFNLASEFLKNKSVSCEVAILKKNVNITTSTCFLYKEYKHSSEYFDSPILTYLQVQRIKSLKHEILEVGRDKRHISQ